MIEAYIGRPGTGKTYTLTERALREKAKGQDVYTNYPVKGCTLFGPDDLLHLPPGVIVIDEAHLWFPARQALRLPPSWLAKLSQTRKSGWTMLWSTQHEKRVDSVLRDVTNWFWLCRCYQIPGSPKPFLFTAQCYEPEEFRQKKKAYYTTRRFFRQQVASAYDTYGSIAVAKHAQSQTDAYAGTEGDAA